jgi:hypothetical protein
MPYEHTELEVLPNDIIKIWIQDISYMFEPIRTDNISMMDATDGMDKHIIGTYVAVRALEIRRHGSGESVINDTLGIHQATMCIITLALIDVIRRYEHQI